jgi:hypothetical protein
MTKPKSKPSAARGLIDKLLSRVVTAGESLLVIEQVARFALALKVSREEFVKFFGELAGTLYDVAERKVKEGQGPAGPKAEKQK